MASFDYCLNPFYPIKECSSCGALYTTDYCCSEWSLIDKIICDLNKTPDLFQEPPQNCPKCGNPVDGQYCQGHTSEPSNDNTNVVNAPQEPFVVKQDPGENSSQSTPQINHHCYYGCGDPLEDIFFYQCTCELCGKGAHYGYNCPPKVSIIPNPKPYNNQTIDELLQTVPSFDPTCYSKDGNSFTYDSKSNLVDGFPNVFNPPPQTLTYSYEFCGMLIMVTIVHFKFHFPVIHQPIHEKTCAELLAEEQEANINTQPFQYFVVPQPPQEEISVEFLQEKRNQIDSMKTSLRKFNQISFYEMPKVLSQAWETILEIELAFEDKHCQPEDILELFRRLHNDVQNIHKELAVYINTLSWDRPTICYNNDDDEDYTIAITPKGPDNSLSMGDHLDTISATESDEFIKSSVENLVSNLSESEGEHECDVPVYEDFITFSNILFDADYDFFSSDDQSFYDEDISKKIYSNPLFDEEIISMKIDPHHLNAESALIESLLNHDSSIISSSSKIDSLFDEFAGELTLLKSIPPGINETDCDPEEETRLIMRLLYDNSYPRPPEEFISENSDAAIESFSPFPIPVEDSDSFMEETDLSFTPDDLMPPNIEEDDYDSERDILILKELLSNDSLSLPEYESFHFDVPSPSHPPAKPPNGNSGILNVKVMGEISEHNVPMPRLMLTQPALVPNQEKSPSLLSHQGQKASQPSAECPMMINGRNTPIMDVSFLHFYPLDKLKVEKSPVKAPDIIIKFLKQAKVIRNATVRYLRTENGTEFLNHTLRNYTEDVGITHMTSTACTPQQNGVVKRRNRTLVEAARTMLIFSKSLLFLWAEAVATV
nr:putative ribonuclease H-like domain-containing protein [Tanacetum cinerariifolium]